MASSNNQVVLEGNLTKDPTLRFTGDGTPVCRFTIAVDREGSKKGDADYFDVYAWRKTGEACANYKKKGHRVRVEGALRLRSYEAQDGTNRRKVEVEAYKVGFLPKRGAAIPQEKQAAYRCGAGEKAIPSPAVSGSVGRSGEKEERWKASWC